MDSIISKAETSAAESIPDICTSGQSQDTSNRKVYLKLKYDSHGYPYFVPIDENIERGYRKTK